MTKVKANALWNNLTSDQLKALDRWLFEEKQGYKTVLEKARTQLGYKGSISSLQRYFLRRRKERAVEEFREMSDEALAVNGAPADPDVLHRAAKKLLARFLFEQLRRSPEDVKEALSVARLMVQNDYNEVLREMKAGDQKLRREAMEFARDKFRYDVVENAVKALPELQKVAEAMGDADSTRYRESANQAKRAMFGSGTEGLAKDAVGIKHEDRVKENIEQPTSNAQHPRGEDGQKDRTRGLRIEDGEGQAEA